MILSREKRPGGLPPGPFISRFTDRIRGRSTEIYLAAISVLAVVVRVLPWRASISKDHVLFIQPDAYYHLRRATIIAKNFPFYPTIDHYMAYPFGAEPPWPPLYDFFLAVVSLVAGMGRFSERALLLATAFLPPILAGLSVIPAFLLTREIFGRRAAHVAAFFAVLMPGQLGYSVVGSGDHHIAEVLFFTLYLYFVVRALRLAGVPVGTDSAGSGEEAAPRGKAPLRETVLAGISLGTVTLIWQGAMTFATLGATCLGVLLLREEDAARAGMISRIGVLHLGVAASLAALGRVIVPPATEQTVFGFGFFSWFQPFYLLLLAAALVLLQGILRGLRKRGFSGGRIIGIGLAAILATSAICMVVVPVRRNLLQALEFVLRTHPYLQSISEFQPLIEESPWHGALDLRFAFDALYLFGFIIPFLIAARIAWTRRLKGMTAGEWVFLLWTALFGFLTFEQKRWSNVYSVNMAAGIGVFVVAVLDRTRLGQRVLGDFQEWRRETGRVAEGEGGGIAARILLYSRRFPVVFAVLAAVVFFIPYYLTVFSMVSPRALVIHPDLYNSMAWIRLNTPPTRSPWRPVEKPEYGILAAWDLGHYLQYIAERPTVANNFGYQLRGEGLEDSVRMYLHREERDVLELCDRRGVRYLLLTNVFPGMDTMGPIIGADFVRDFTAVAASPGHPGGPMLFPSDRYFALASQRMYVFDGSATTETEAIGNFRLVFESERENGEPYLPPGVKFVKLFERVKGARIRGRATPGLPVNVSIRMMTNFDRFFDYVSLARADAKGNFVVTVPYASSGTTYPVRAVSPYLAMTEKEAAFFQVTEKDIMEGNEIVIDLKTVGLPQGKHPPVGSRGAPPGKVQERRQAE